MHILIIGGGGREHALAWKIVQSPLVSRLSIAPGNAGTVDLAEPVTLAIEDGAAVAAWAVAHGVDLVVIGPEAPLAAGVADAVRAAGVAAFGPGQAAAALEASKAFTKEICDACGAPTAAWARFSDHQAALDYVRGRGAPIVIKADGLAAGKGVVVATDLEQAEAGLSDMFGGAFGAAGAEVVIEECLEGEEASFFVITDGETVLPLATAQDHKRALDGDLGPNTGGMGAYSPAPVLTDAVVERTLAEIVRPTIAEMARRGTPFTGVLYVGLMIRDGAPKLIEYNVRFGDPECQVIMLRLESDLVPALMACASGGLADVALEWRDEPALTVVMATKGYPGSYPKGTVIAGLAQAGRVPGVTVFHAGTDRDGADVVATGGRVLNVTAVGATLQEARERAYRAVDLIEWPEGFCRRDIAWRALPGPSESPR
ncbi:MAG: phosphoribosylamine--glycine ligase [Pseudomonadota bacterium]